MSILINRAVSGFSPGIGATIARVHSRNTHERGDVSSIAATWYCDGSVPAKPCSLSLRQPRRCFGNIIRDTPNPRKLTAENLMNCLDKAGAVMLPFRSSLSCIDGWASCTKTGHDYAAWELNSTCLVLMAKGTKDWGSAVNRSRVEKCKETWLLSYRASSCGQSISVLIGNGFIRHLNN